MSGFEVILALVAAYAALIWFTRGSRARRKAITLACRAANAEAKVAWKRDQVARRAAGAAPTAEAIAALQGQLAARDATIATLRQQAASSVGSFTAVMGGLEATIAAKDRTIQALVGRV